MAPLSFFFMGLNSWILEGVFSRLLDRPPVPFFPIPGFGMSVEVTDLFLLGFTFTIAEVAVGGDVFWAREAEQKGFFYMVLTPLICLGLIEVGVNAVDKYLIATEEKLALSPMINGLFGALQATVSLGMSLVAGYFTIHKLCVPLLDAVGQAFKVAGQGIARTAGRFSLCYLLLQIGALVDEGFYERLRALDRIILDLWRRLFRREVSHAA